MGKEDYIITGIINEDGTDLIWPPNPLKEKWEKLYPPTKQGEPCSPELGHFNDGKPIMNYSCVLCCEEKCFHSNNWTVPEEDREVYEKYLEECKEYYNKHNPSAREK